MCAIEMGRIIRTARLHIEAVAAAFFIRDRDGAPTSWHASIIGEDKASIKRIRS